MCLIFCVKVPRINGNLFAASLSPQDPPHKCRILHNDLHWKPSNASGRMSKCLIYWLRMAWIDGSLFVGTTKSARPPPRKCSIRSTVEVKVEVTVCKCLCNQPTRTPHYDTLLCLWHRLLTCSLPLALTSNLYKRESIDELKEVWIKGLGGRSGATTKQKGGSQCVWVTERNKW